MTKDQKIVEPQPEADSFFEKLEQGETTPTQVSQAVVAKILLELKKLKK